MCTARPAIAMLALCALAMLLMAGARVDATEASGPASPLAGAEKPLRPDEGWVVVAVAVPVLEPLPQDTLRIERTDGGSGSLTSLKAFIYSRSTTLFMGRARAGAYRIHSLFDSKVAGGVGGALGYALANQRADDTPIEFTVQAGRVADLGVLVTHAPEPNRTDWVPRLMRAGHDPRVSDFAMWLWPELRGLAREAVGETDAGAQARIADLRAGAPIGANWVTTQDGQVVSAGPLGGLHEFGAGGSHVRWLGPLVNLTHVHRRGDGRLFVSGEFGTLLSVAPDGRVERVAGLPASTSAVRATWTDAAGQLYALVGDGLHFMSMLEMPGDVPIYMARWRPSDAVLLVSPSGVGGDWQRLTAIGWPPKDLKAIALDRAFVIFHPDGKVIRVDADGHLEELAARTEFMDAAGPDRLVAWDGSKERVSRALIGDDSATTWRESGNGNRKAAPMAKVRPPLMVTPPREVVLGRARLRSGSQVYRRAFYASDDEGANYSKLVEVPSWCGAPTSLGVARGRVWMACVDGSVSSLDPSSGELRTERPAPSPFRGSPPPH